MTSLERVRRARIALLAAALVRSALLAGFAFLLGLGLAAAIDLAVPLAVAVRRAVLPVAAVLAAGVLAVRLWRARKVASLGQVALYLEALTPELRFALITAVEPAGRYDPARLDAAVSRDFEPGALTAMLRQSLIVPLAALIVAAMSLLLLPGGSFARVARPHPGDLLDGVRASGRGALDRIAVRVTPPTYSQQPGETIDDPLSVRALVGSRLEIRGAGSFHTERTMPVRPEVVRLTDGAQTRLLTLEPVADAIPVVRLRLPASDTTYETPRGALPVEATATDDIGLARLWIELLITTGGGERFTTTALVLGEVPGRSGRAAESRFAIRLDTMKLGPGDVLSLRAIARDRNDVTGPGEGTSDTRTLRMADPEARNEIRIVPAASATLDTSVISQRMLIIRAETLLVRRSRMTADSFAARSLQLAERQRMLYDRVQALILELETATDVGFVGETEESILLRQAGTAMRRAEDELRKVRVQLALPEMYRALDALDKGRTARRIYLRGMLPRIVVDLDQVRLKGKEPPPVGAREPRSRLSDARRALLQRLDRLLAPGGPGGAELADSLTMLRADALADAPTAAPHLARALELLRAGRDPHPAAGGARRVLERDTQSVPALSPWRGGK